MARNKGAKNYKSNDEPDKGVGLSPKLTGAIVSGFDRFARKYLVKVADKVPAGSSLRSEGLATAVDVLKAFVEGIKTGNEYVDTALEKLTDYGDIFATALVAREGSENTREKISADSVAWLKKFSTHIQKLITDAPDEAALRLLETRIPLEFELFLKGHQLVDRYVKDQVETAKRESDLAKAAAKAALVPNPTLENAKRFLTNRGSAFSNKLKALRDERNLASLVTDPVVNPDPVVSSDDSEENN